MSCSQSHRYLTIPCSSFPSSSAILIVENLIQGFFRVLRDTDDRDYLNSSFPQWEQQLFLPGAANTLDDITRRRILDFPDVKMQSHNINRSSSRSKSELLRVAASSPRDLTDDELNLLRDRYWLNVNPEELSARVPHCMKSTS